MNLMHGDCLELMAKIPGGSVDMILCDLPYGTTACKWDTVIPFEPLWAQYKRIAKPNAAIVLTASQPFTSALVMSNTQKFKYAWIWEKNVPSGFLNAKRQPMRWTEDICVFYGAQCTYNPQFRLGRGYKVKVTSTKSENYGAQRDVVSENDGTKYYPKNILEIANENGGGKLHPTQKPVALMEYLIRTYTNEGETVLDNCMGSGTTGLACVNTGRDFIGIEKDAAYFAIAKGRIESAKLPLLEAA